MSDDYAVLAPLYESLGMAAFAEMLSPHLIDYAQSHDWIGRRVVDLGCGTGASVRWLANHGYNVTGIDLSPSMLKLAEQLITGSGSGISYQLYEGDIRALSDLHDIDLVLALDVLNELNSLRDLEAVFAALGRLLAPDKLFVFDLHTISGLAVANQASTSITETDDFAVFVARQFDYERQAAANSYSIFRRDAAGWQRQHTQRTLRGFPVQVVIALLQRAGFGIMALTDTRLEPLNPAEIDEPRVIVFARRVRPESD